MQVEIYTDGAAKGNPGPGGYGVILVHGEQRREFQGGFVRTTNNRMELLAAITGLESLTETSAVTLYSDSRYLVDAMTKGWLESWRSRGWKRPQNQPLKNPDLWQRLDRACNGRQVDWRWVKGHAGHAENERCDELATLAATGDDREVDAGFEAAEAASAAQLDLFPQ